MLIARELNGKKQKPESPGGHGNGNGNEKREDGIMGNGIGMESIGSL